MDLHLPALRTLTDAFHFLPLVEDSALLEASTVLDLSFQVPKGGHFFDDFPVWNQSSDGDSIFRLGAFSSNGKLAACASARVAELRISSAVIRIGMIGMVATRPEFQGQGLASRLVEALVQWLQTQGATLVVLWGGDQNLYRRLGFAPCGEQGFLPLADLRKLATPVDSEMGIGWRPELFEMLKARSSGLVLDEQDRNWMSAHKNVRWFWTRSPGGVSAYAAFGRGIDLGGMVHEWGGNPQALRRLLTWIARANPEGYLLGSPQMLQPYLGPETGAILLQPLCLAKILSPRVFLDAGVALSDLWFWGLDSA